MMDSLIYLLDTNILSHLMKNPRGPVMRRITTFGEEAICTSIIVASELRYGADKKGSPKLPAKVEEILENIEVLPLDIDADLHYGSIRSYLENRGEVIGPNDMLIAAHARSLGLILVTDNTREYERVPDLTVENWLLPPPAL